MLSNAISTERVSNLGQIPCGSRTTPWYCYKSHPGKQYVALSELAAQSFRAHAPRFMDPAKPRSAPPALMFGPYGFVSFDIADPRWRAIHNTRGVASLISWDALHPIPVPDGIVEALQARGRPGDGVIDDLYQGPSMTPHSDLSGQQVKITSGPFADLHGICRWSNQKRVGVLLEVMGKLVETRVKRGQVEGVKKT